MPVIGGTNVIVGRGISRSATVLLARIVGANQVPILPSSVTAIAYAVRDLTLGTTTGSGTLIIGSVVYGSLSLANGWTSDSAASPGPDGLAGWNFAWTVPASLTAFSTGPQDTVGNFLPHRFQADVQFTMTNGDSFEQPFLFNAAPAYI